MKNMKKLLVLVLALAMALCLCACGSKPTSAPAGPDSNPSSSNADNSANTETITLKWGDHYPSGTPGALAIDAFAASVGEATEGRVVVKTYHDAVLGSAGDALSMVSSGVADIVWTSSAIFNGQFPYTDMLSLPMLGIGDAMGGTNAIWDLYEQYPDAFAEEYANYHVLMLHCSPANILGTTTVINTVDDIAGLNIRAGTGSPTAVATLWGATPVAIATPDLYTSVQKGVVDGYIFDGSGINTWGLAELTNTMIDVGLGYNVCPVLMNLDAWNSISAEDQEIINNLACRTGSLALAAAMQGEADGMVENYSGVYNKYAPGDAEYEALKTPLVSYVDEWAQNMTTDSIDARAMVDLILNGNY